MNYLLDWCRTLFHKQNELVSRRSSCTKSIFPNIMSMFEFDAYDLFWLNCTRTKLTNLDLPELRRRFA